MSEGAEQSRVLITGAGGNLAQYLCAGAPANVEVHGTWRRTKPACTLAHQVELTEEGAMLALLRELRPKVVIHAAYGTSDLARDVVEATRQVALACAATETALIQVSTDCVFDGLAGPYAEDATPSPINPYGVAKAEAERLVRELVPSASVVRVSLIVGLSPMNASTGWMVEKGRAGEQTGLFVDELRSPIGAEDLAAMLWELVGLPRPQRTGIWHLAGPESLSRFAYGLLLARSFDFDPAVFVPAWSRDLAVPRPLDIRLSTRRADSHLRHRPQAISALLAGRSRQAR